MGFEPDQVDDVVFWGEAWDLLFFVLGYAVGEVAGHTYVEDSGFAGHYVDVGRALHCVDCGIGRDALQLGRLGDGRRKERRRDSSLRGSTHSQEANGEEKVGLLRSE